MKYSAEEVIEQVKREYPYEPTPGSEESNRHFSAEFKRRIVFEANANDISNRVLAKNLGISHSTVCNWKHRLNDQEIKQMPRKKAAFKKLELEVEGSLDKKMQGYVEGKSGVRVLGLSLSQIAELLRCL